MRSAWQRLLFFFVCVAIGVAGIVALRSLVFQPSGPRWTRDAKALTAADIVISTAAGLGRGTEDLIAGAIPVPAVRAPTPSRR